jgi:hypothetical protein
MSATLDKIIEEVRALAPEERQQLLEMLEQETHGSERARRATLARSIRGKYARLLTGSEEFIALKREETKLEDSKFRDRR